MLAFHTWWPSLNPFGVWSVRAALISAAAWFLVDRQLLRNRRRQAWLTIVAPLLLLAFVFHSKVHVDLSPPGLAYDWPDWRYHPPDAQDYFADYIFIVVALVLAFKATRLSSRDLRMLGFVVASLALVFFALEAHLSYHDLYVG